MKKAIGLVVAISFAVATIGVAGDAFARGGGSGGSTGSTGGSSGGSTGSSTGGAPSAGTAAPSAAASAASAPGSPSNVTGNMSEDVSGVYAFPRVGVVGCTTTNFGAGGGIVPTPCPTR